MFAKLKQKTLEDKPKPVGQNPPKAEREESKVTLLWMGIN
jgi:hypothetical protein